MLQDMNNENIAEINKLNDEKIQLQNQGLEHFKHIEKLTDNYVSIKFIYLVLKCKFK